MRFLLFLLLFAAFSCGGSEGESCDIGSEGCSCFDNGTCNSGLSCKSDICVNPGGTQEEIPDGSIGIGKDAGSDDAFVENSLDGALTEKDTSIEDSSSGVEDSESDGEKS